MNTEFPNENELVAMALFEYLKSHGVGCWWENEPYEMSLVENINPYFFIGLDVIGGGKFKVRYVGGAGEIVIVDLRWGRPNRDDGMSLGVINTNMARSYPVRGTFPVCDPDCFEMVLEIVK